MEEPKGGVHPDQVAAAPVIVELRRGGNGRIAALTGLRKGSETGTDSAADSAVETDEQEKRSLRCGSCGHEVTSLNERIAIQGKHEHRFVNPGGYVFRIGCFRRAPGCIASGEPTAHFTWFSGYLWSFAVCGSCLAHLGWAYESGSDDSFFGLILDRLVI